MATGRNKMVGVAGFEPTTPTPPVWCATRLRYTPTKRLYMSSSQMQTQKGVVSAFDTGQSRTGVTQQFKSANMTFGSLLWHSISRKTFLL